MVLSCSSGFYAVMMVAARCFPSAFFVIGWTILVKLRLTGFDLRQFLAY
ncbi:hypothetical protein HMPREF0758_0789 [Serratia odorifera DSM 4582]|uniref:Uncharacterized protein n=1 Tax=Serratia odorifera DSM 4582 TaxID=667129 RepID=D4DY06_SEROD|nr:hypothetical protein HMPREF0758_0789 [Serratia odorifera DSM 4582]